MVEDMRGVAGTEAEGAKSVSKVEELARPPRPLRVLTRPSFLVAARTKDDPDLFDRVIHLSVYVDTDTPASNENEQRLRQRPS